MKKFKPLLILLLFIIYQNNAYSYQNIRNTPIVIIKSNNGIFSYEPQKINNILYKVNNINNTFKYYFILEAPNEYSKYFNEYKKIVNKVVKDVSAIPQNNKKIRYQLNNNISDPIVKIFIR